MFNIKQRNHDCTSSPTQRLIFNQLIHNLFSRSLRICVYTYAFFLIYVVNEGVSLLCGVFKDQSHMAMEVTLGEAYEIKGLIILTGPRGGRHGREPCGRSAQEAAQPNRWGAERQRASVGSAFLGGSGGVHKQNACGIFLVLWMSLGHREAWAGELLAGTSLITLTLLVIAHRLCVEMLRHQDDRRSSNLTVQLSRELCTHWVVWVAMRTRIFWSALALLVLLTLSPTHSLRIYSLSSYCMSDSF